MAQARVLGGSLGIAASTAILGDVERTQLSDIPRAALTSLQSSAKTLTPSQDLAIRNAYSKAFDNTLAVTAVVACFSFLCALMTYQRHARMVDPRLAVMAATKQQAAAAAST